MVDLGDIIGVEGVMFKINMGEIFVKVKLFILLFKLLWFLFDKFYGL